MQMRTGDFTSAKSVLADMLSHEPHSLEAHCDLAACYYNTYQFEEFKTLTEKSYLLLSKFGILPFEQNRTVSIVLKLGKALEELGCVDKAIKIFKTNYTVQNEEDQIKHIKILCQKLRLACDLEYRDDLLSTYKLLEVIPVKGLDSDVDRFHALIKADGILVGPTMAIQRCHYVLSHHAHLPEEHKQWLSFDLVFDLLRIEKVVPSLDNILKLFEYNKLGPFEKIVWDIYKSFTNEKSIIEFDSVLLVGLNLMSSIKIVDTILFLGIFKSQKQEMENKLRMLLSSLNQESRKALIPMLKSEKITVSSEKVDLSLTKTENLILESFLNSKSESIDLEKICMILYQSSADLYAIGRLKVTLSRLNKKMFVKTGDPLTFGIRNGSLILLRNSILNGRKSS